MYPCLLCLGKKMSIFKCIFCSHMSLLFSKCFKLKTEDFLSKVRYRKSRIRRPCSNKRPSLFFCEKLWQHQFVRKWKSTYWSIPAPIFALTIFPNEYKSSGKCSTFKDCSTLKTSKLRTWRIYTQSQTVEDILNLVARTRSYFLCTLFKPIRVLLGIFRFKETLCKVCFFFVQSLRADDLQRTRITDYM